MLSVAFRSSHPAHDFPPPVWVTLYWFLAEIRVQPTLWRRTKSVFNNWRNRRYYRWNATCTCTGSILPSKNHENIDIFVNCTDHLSCVLTLVSCFFCTKTFYFGLLVFLYHTGTLAACWNPRSNSMSCLWQCMIALFQQVGYVLNYWDNSIMMNL